MAAASVTQRVHSWCDRWNTDHRWDHNAYYHDWVLRRVPDGAGAALDVGCGTGDLVRQLAQRFEHVTGVDADPVSVQIAQRLSAGVGGVELLCGNLMTADLPGRYDVITALAVLHHVPFEPALVRLRDLLGPGGTLVVLGLYREDTFVDQAISALAVPANVLMGGLNRYRRGSRERPVSMTAPATPASMTLAAIRKAAKDHTPGAVLRRHLFWRYSLVYRAS